MAKAQLACRKSGVKSGHSEGPSCEEGGYREKQIPRYARDDGAAGGQAATQLSLGFSGVSSAPLGLAMVAKVSTLNFL